MLFLKKKIFFINYLPLWNFLIFALCPPNTHFGPITGSIYRGSIKNFDGFLRKYLMPFFFKFSLFFLKIRGQNLLFSTENLKEVVEKKIKKKTFYNFYLDDFNFKNNLENKNRDIDLIVYYRNYNTKNSSFLKKVILNISKSMKVYLVGDILHIKNVTNLGNIENNELLKYISRSKASLISAENFSSLFARDCMQNNLIIFHDYKDLIPSIFRNYTDIIKPINYDDVDGSIVKIRNEIQNLKTSYQNQKQINFDNFFKENFFS